MAQFGRRMRLRRLYEGSPEEGSEVNTVSPQYTDDVSRSGGQYTNELKKRMQQVEDKAVVMDTTSRRVLIEGDRLKTKMLEIEADAQKSISDLTTGMERSLRSSAEARREIELTRDWAANYIGHQISHETNSIKNMINTEIQAIKQYFTMQLEGSSTTQSMVDTKLKLQADALKHQTSDRFDKITSRITGLENTAQDLFKKVEGLGAHCSETLETAMSREKAARERDFLDTESAIKQLAASYSGTIERELSAAVKKNSEFAETSLERMQAIERLLKVEIRNRMELSAKYDKLVEDVHKAERTAINTTTYLETLVTDKTNDLGAALAQHSHMHKESINMVKDSSKQLITSRCELITADLSDTRGTLVKKIEKLEAATTELGSKTQEISLLAVDYTQSIQELREAQQREGKEVKNMLSKVENKWDEDLSKGLDEVRGHVSTQQQSAVKEAVQREGYFKEQFTTDLRHVTEAIAAQKKTNDSKYQELKQVVQESSAMSSSEWDKSLAKVTVLIQKTDELSRAQAEKTEQACEEMRELALSVQEARSQISSLETLCSSHADANEKKAFRSELEVLTTKIEKVDHAVVGLNSKVFQSTAEADVEALHVEVLSLQEQHEKEVLELGTRLEKAEDAVKETIEKTRAMQMSNAANKEVDAMREQLEASEIERGVHKAEIEILAAKVLDVNEKLNEDKEMADTALKDITSAVVVERKKLQTLQDEVAVLQESDKERQEGDGLWDAWRDAITSQHFDAKLGSSTMFESFVRLLVKQEEQFQRAIIMTDFDIRELAERVEMDFKEGRAISENILKFYESEKKDYDRRAGSISK
eukprot:TRINITY_DN14682_c0_g1_i1.p1 TRINITY_DN14682_c0_g1~~TRINITY_DN14682_c0_g1_i1.p1  ORF type:complete len:822 (+),score=265.46 TRINITY_DN14682_c0_g1_i1:2672-5137(+)